MPSTQVLPPVHVAPPDEAQLPQLLLSVWTSTHAPAQSV
jgi:hypothetical protein